MNSYLSGYLSSIPKSEYQNILSFLEKHMSSKLLLNEEEIKDVIEKVSEQVTKATEAIPNERPKDTYNRFFKEVSIDLVYLYKIIDALESAIDSYSYLSSSYLSDIKSELDKLELKVIGLKTKYEYKNNTIVISETFKDTSSFEKITSENAYLFYDRDGSLVETANIVHRNTDDMLVLSTAESVDALHNKNGKTIGYIEVLDYRGVPIDTYNDSSNAIDGSETSYWDTSVVTDYPVNVAMNGYEPGGVYMKFSLKLAKTSMVSELSLTPYCIYPLEIVDIIVNDQSVIEKSGAVETISTNTMTFNFHPVIADEVIIITRQVNYTRSIVRSNAKEDEAEELLMLVGNKKKASFTKEYKDQSEYSDDNIYLKYSEKHKDDIDNWNGQMERGDIDGFQ